jgi:hypothetical protein
MPRVRLQLNIGTKDSQRLGLDANKARAGETIDVRQAVADDQPGYGEQTAGSARAFWRATRLPDAQVVRRLREGSLLAANFNGLWCDALNLARAGRPDYFAMQHADVEPRTGGSTR